ncbi:ferredoxin [Rhodococcoides trifolii]|uniref:Ferredoxin n=1 Tax=Rhodococcoides trifolii TaxID=908250 RepID=A0A917G7X7_9NOCA|nr:PDR/VanB family oxidoreductase [Rhodococcus trifolii]GGG27042.1 ferredoxin [Rhodococcus trifolii]
MSIGIPSWMRPAETAEPVKTITVEVLARRGVADNVVELTIGGRGRLPEWTPGSHIDLHLPGGLIRQYSLCGDSHDLDTYRIAVLRESRGRGGSVHLHDTVSVGSVLAISGPRNHFELESAAKYVFIAGGIGITPLLPMINAVNDRGGDWTLDYCGRTRSTMAYADRLADDSRVRIASADNGRRLDVRHLLAEPDPGTAVYCCGPKSLLDAVDKESAAWPEGAIHTERFTPKDVDLPTSSFDVRLARSDLSLHVPAERALIDVLEDAGVVVPASCREGTCGTCETIVLDGTPQHRDSVLTQAEQDAGDSMMVCVSRSCEAPLLLDL